MWTFRYANMLLLETAAALCLDSANGLQNQFNSAASSNKQEARKNKSC